MEIVLKVIDYIILGYILYPYEQYPNLIKNVKIYLTLMR
jgi:hypothetical protein